MRFFLSYVEHSGGLVDAGADGAVVVLTEPLCAQLALPETLSVTDDPETGPAATGPARLNRRPTGTGVVLHGGPNLPDAPGHRLDRTRG
jgi:hypothetical protein